MSGKVANYSGALNIGDKARLVYVSAYHSNRLALEALLDRECIVRDKVLSKTCTLWYYVSFQLTMHQSATYVVSRDMLK